jgi:hypothetical protein
MSHNALWPLTTKNLRKGGVAVKRACFAIVAGEHYSCRVCRAGAYGHRVDLLDIVRPADLIPDPGVGAGNEGVPEQVDRNYRQVDRDVAQHVQREQRQDPDPPEAAGQAFGQRNATDGEDDREDRERIVELRATREGEP